MEKVHKSFTELEVWQKARQFKNDMSELTKRFPGEEKFRLSDQLIRASRSVASNIVEGHGRYTFKDQIYFCIQARGSASESLNHLIDAFDLKFINAEELKRYKEQVDELERLINGYINYLRKNVQ